MASSADSEPQAPKNIVDASEEDDFEDDDQFEWDLGLLSPMPEPGKACQSTQPGAGALTTIQWHKHSHKSNVFLNGDWKEWDGGVVGGRPVRNWLRRLLARRKRRNRFPLLCRSGCTPQRYPATMR